MLKDNTKNEVTASVNKFGKGYAYRFGSLLGTNYDQQSNYGLAHLLRYLMQKARCNFFPTASGGVVTRLAHTNSDYLLFLFNPLEEALTTKLQVQSDRNSFRNLFTGEYAQKQDDGSITLTLKARQATIMELK